MTTWHAYSPTGALVRTFGSADLAEDYRVRMGLIGCEIRIEAVWIERRAA